MIVGINKDRLQTDTLCAGVLNLFYIAFAVVLSSSLPVSTHTQIHHLFTNASVYYSPTIICNYQLQTINHQSNRRQKHQVCLIPFFRYRNHLLHFASKYEYGAGRTQHHPSVEPHSGCLVLLFPVAVPILKL